MKKYKYHIISIIVLIVFCVSLCFVPIDASRFIPVIESQVSKDLGVKIHIEKLILRFGPLLKVKAPVMHIMYEDGQKFGQFDNVRFLIPWSTLIKNDVIVNRLYADNLIVKVNSDDKYLNEFVSKLKEKSFNEIPDATLKAYNITYFDTKLDKKYKITGKGLETAKIVNYENIKVKADGEFFINDKKYLSYDISLLPNVKFEHQSTDFDFANFIEQMETLDFHSDIIADLKFYNNINGNLQISGLVNIDNISVLDKENKVPKSFIYLTFLGEKIGVLSNIYASNNEKAYIDGVINNSKKRSVDLKVKTDEINLYNLFQKLKLLADFSKCKSIDSINGTLKADFSIKGDVNKIKSSGYLKISNASISANGVDIKNISSNIDFSNNTINITDAIGYVKNAPIMLKGKIDKHIDLEVLMNKVELKHLCPSSLGVKNGIASIAANISGTFDNIVHKENILIEDFKYINNENSITFSNLKIDTNKDNIAYINNILINTINTEQIKLPLLKLHIVSDKITIPETNVFMPNSKLILKAEAANFNSKELTFNTVLDGNINSRDIKPLNKTSGNYPVKLLINGTRSIQNIAAQILLEKANILDEPSIINCAAKLESNNLKIDDLSISSFSGNLSNDLKQNIKGSKKLAITGNIDNIKEPVFKNLRIFIPQQLNITYLDTVAQLKGDLFINGNLTNPEIIGQMNIPNVINQFLQISASNLNLDFKKSIAVMNAPVIKLGDSVVSLNSTVSNDISDGILVKNINVKSKFINLDTFLMYKDSPLFKSIPITVADGKLYSERVNANIYNAPIVVTALSTDFTLDKDIMTAKNLSAEIYNGKLAGKAEFNLKDEDFKTLIQARGVSASPIFDIVSTRKESVSGSMDFDTDIQGNLTSKQSLNGNIKFIVHNGRMSSLGKLEHLLYAQNVVADNMLRTSLSVVTKAITLKDTGLFKYLRGDVTLKNGIADVKYLQSQGPHMALYIKGTYNPDNDYAKFTVLGRLSDEVVSGLGAFGEFSLNKLMVMLTGEENKYNILPEDFDKIPALNANNTKEFRSIINGIVDKPSSVLQFNWISYSQKSYKQKDVPMTNMKVPDFIDSLPY